jgi:glycine/D-amino acid oxidase-like deaminating enzyme
MKSIPHIAVIGAGAFGGWTALRLLEHGARVTLLDAWGPGNSRASSGGETRVMRGTYGPDQPYTEMAARALKLWAKYERRWERQFLHRSGVLWMASGRNIDDGFERGSVEALRVAKIKFQELSTPQMKKRWPQINFEGIEWGIFEPECGYLDARASCQAVVAAFVAAGGKYRQAAALADGLESELLCGRAPLLRGRAPLLRGRAALQGRVNRVKSERASAPVVVAPSGNGVFPQPLEADIYVFACGPWLGKLFPATIGDLIQPTKQDIFFFGAPAGDDRFSDAHLPVWADHRGRFRYGIPGALSGDARRGFKIADDTRGPAFDPTDGERVVDPNTLKDIREYVGFRFPALKNAPLVETRVCQYEQTPDSHFILDRHPARENVWIVGGGSGHGFKHGPAVGEMMADLILKDREPDAIFQLGRFQR